MPLFICDNKIDPRSATVFFRDLYAICAHDNMFLDFQQIPPDALGFTYYKILYTPQLNLSLQDPGVQMIDYLVNHHSGRVEINGMKSDDPSVSPSNPTGTMKEIYGVTHINPNDGSAKIYYDMEECNGNGLLVYGQNEILIESPTHVILFHEFVHVRYPNQENHDFIIEQENLYRKSKGLPIRGDGRSAGCGRPSNWSLGSLCFIATAATGGPNSPEVRFLRGIRENQLIRTRWGRKFFETFYKHYYQYSPAIAEEMHKNSEIRDVFGWALVTPLLNYFRLVITRPDWDLQDVPLPLRSYLESMGKEMDDWLAKIELPTEFASISPEEASIELSTILRYVLRSPSVRSNYLEDLTRRGSLPLSGSEQALLLANRYLKEAEVPLDECIKIIGSKSFVSEDVSSE